MIVFGVISLIVGAVLYFMGTNINNDMDAQMESFFNDGITNPGSTYETIGIILLIVGGLLVIVGVILRISQTSINTNVGDNRYANTWLCSCGARNSNCVEVCSCGISKDSIEQIKKKDHT